jgi:GDPmannose 4,6-dehydratase
LTAIRIGWYAATESGNGAIRPTGVHGRGEKRRASFLFAATGWFLRAGGNGILPGTARCGVEMAKIALITGVTGQDGSYLAEFLLKKGCEVHGVVRRTSSFATGRIDHLRTGFGSGSGGLQLHYGDLGDGTGLRRIIEQVRPDEVYNLAAQSHVRISFDQPEYTADVVGLGALRLLEALRDHNKRRGRAARLYQAGSSEMFGKVTETPQRETTPFHPRSPYACAKVYAHWQTINYREAFGLFACNGILFNHESPRRGENFVTRKITRSATRIKLGLQEKLALGNLDARRDWGFAGDYVEAMWLMLQQELPDDYVIATGETHQVQEFLEVVFDRLKMKWQDHVEIDQRFFRPAEVDVLIGDASKAKRVLGWEPKVKFKKLAEMMVEADLELAERELRSKAH